MEFFIASSVSDVLPDYEVDDCKLKSKLAFSPLTKLLSISASAIALFAGLLTLASYLSSKVLAKVGEWIASI